MQTPKEFETQSKQYDFHSIFSPQYFQTQNPNSSQAQAITPWSYSETSHGIFSNLTKFLNPKTQSIEKPHKQPSQSQEVLNFIHQTSKAKKYRSNLGKLRKHLEDNKSENLVDLTLTKIQFPEFQKNKFNSKSLDSDLKLKVKNFSTIQNNFLIMSYFYPENSKIKKIKQSLFFDQSPPKPKQTKKISEVTPTVLPSFISIKSMEYKQKSFSQNLDSIDYQDQIEIQKNQFSSTFRTLSLLKSKKNRDQRKISLPSKYLPSNQVQRHQYKTIQASKEPQKSISDDDKNEYKFVNVDEILTIKISKVSQNPALTTENQNSSFIKKWYARNSVKLSLSSEKSQQLNDSIKIKKEGKTKFFQTHFKEEKRSSSVQKNFNISRTKTTKNSRLNELQPKPQFQNCVQVMKPYGDKTEKRLSGSTL